MTHSIVPFVPKDPNFLETLHREDRPWTMPGVIIKVNGVPISAEMVAVIERAGGVATFTFDEGAPSTVTVESIAPGVTLIR